MTIMTIGIVVSEFNYDITMMMLERAKAHAEFLDVDVKEVIKVLERAVVLDQSFHLGQGEKRGPEIGVLIPVVLNLLIG